MFYELHQQYLEAEWTVLLNQHLNIFLPILSSVRITTSIYYEPQPLMYHKFTHQPLGVSLFCLFRWWRTWAVEGLESLPKVTQLGSSSAGIWNQSPFLSVHQQQHPGDAEGDALENNAFTLKNTWLLSNGLATVKWTLGNTMACLRSYLCLQENSRRTGCMNYGWAYSQQEGRLWFVGAQGHLSEKTQNSLSEHLWWHFPQRSHFLGALSL